MADKQIILFARNETCISVINDIHDVTQLIQYPHDLLGTPDINMAQEARGISGNGKGMHDVRKQHSFGERLGLILLQNKVV